MPQTISPAQGYVTHQDVIVNQDTFVYPNTIQYVSSTLNVPVVLRIRNTSVAALAVPTTVVNLLTITFAVSDAPKVVIVSPATSKNQKILPHALKKLLALEDDAANIKHIADVDLHVLIIVEERVIKFVMAHVLAVVYASRVM